MAYSPYHFSRLFREQVGLSPLYYVSALRLQKAKDLLIHTDFSIRDIGLEIGQMSLGTFTTRFSECVGVTPSEFRRSLPRIDTLKDSLIRLGVWREIEPHSSAIWSGSIRFNRNQAGCLLFDGNRHSVGVQRARFSSSPCFPPYPKP
ncbi:helix-turn-helix transcriptional regulator [Cohnella terricola]|uniref:helix-turn-helix transcriptional regulator n=1 Tax=Cohnella terricola TaxID=1289167 RepID=UPI003CCC6BFD